MTAPLLAALALTASAAAVDPPYNWATDTHGPSGGAQFAATQGVCRRLGPPRPPAADRPNPAQTAALKGCDAEKLYYGEGVKPDYVRARQCAFTPASQDEVFGGATILMQVYANGLGVGRNLDLATAYACTVGGAPAENDGRVKHLQALKSKPEATRFDICDDITSGYMQGFCQRRASTGAAVGRDARVQALTAHLPPAAQAAFPPLKRAFDAFVHARGDEVDQTGTARAAFVLEDEDRVRDQFAADLKRLTTSGWPRATDAAAADAALNAAYRAALASAAGQGNDSTVKPKGVRAAQRAWITYRDAFLRFAAAAAPAVPRDAVLAHLTRLRTGQLRGLPVS